MRGLSHWEGHPRKQREGWVQALHSGRLSAPPRDQLQGKKRVLVTRAQEQMCWCKGREGEVGPEGTARPPGDEQAPETRSERREHLSARSCLSNSRSGAALPTAGPSPPPHSSYKCLRMRVAVDEVDGGTLPREVGSGPPPLSVPCGDVVFAQFSLPHLESKGSCLCGGPCGNPGRSPAGRAQCFAANGSSQRRRRSLVALFTRLTLPNSHFVSHVHSAVRG